MSSRKNQPHTKLAFSTCKLNDVNLLNYQLENLVFTYTDTPSSEFGFSHPIQVSEVSSKGSNHPSFCNNGSLGFAHIGPIEQAIKGFLGKGREAAEGECRAMGSFEGLSEAAYENDCIVSGTWRTTDQT